MESADIVAADCYILHSVSAGLGRCMNIYGITNTFSGLVYCADCEEKLYYGATSNGKRRQKIRIEYDGIGFIPLEELAKSGPPV